MYLSIYIYMCVYIYMMQGCHTPTPPHPMVSSCIPTPPRVVVSLLWWALHPLSLS